MKKLLSLLLVSVLALPACASQIEREVDSTVLVHMKIQMQTPKGIRIGWGTCSGVYIKKNEVLTASHCVIPDEDDIKIKEIWISQINGVSGKATVELISSERDLCILHTNQAY